MGQELFADRALATRLERAEGHANAAFVDSRARQFPESGAVWRDIAGTFAMFDGVGSPLTQTFGLGIARTPTDADLAEVEEFFEVRGAEIFHEVSPLADPAVLTLLPARRYRPLEFSTVLFQSIDDRLAVGPDGSAQCLARPIVESENDLWAATAGAGWGAESAEVGEFMREFGAISTRAHGTVCFLATVGDEPVAAAAMAIHEGVALLAGAATRMEWRGRGAQSALLRARLRHALEAGCDVAMMGAAPGSASQRNAERQAFQVAYTRLKWRRD